MISGFRLPDHAVIPPPKRAPVALLFSLLVVTLTVPCWQASQAETLARPTHYDVVPPSWISDRNNAERNPDISDDNSNAYVFPSLYGSDVGAALNFSLSNFFLHSNRFRGRRSFVWQGGAEKPVTIVVVRNDKEGDAAIEIDDKSASAIRSLSWLQFQALQRSFRRWLCRNSGCPLFGECRSRFTDLYGDLLTMWKVHVLADSTFKSFAARYLNTTQPRPIEYSGDPDGPIVEAQTRMSATRIVRGEALLVTWGNINFYPSRAATAGYSRVTSGGTTEVCRYYANWGTKRLSATELQNLRGAGLKVVVIWEDGRPTTASYFSFTKGVDDGTSAYHDALQISQPSSAPIYFAVDYDASDADLAAGINDYFNGVGLGIKTAANGGAENPIGVYGSGATCRFALVRGWARYTWLAMSSGWRGHDFPDWNVRQSTGTTYGSIDVDFDESSGNDFGSF